MSRSRQNLIKFFFLGKEIKKNSVPGHCIIIIIIIMSIYLRLPDLCSSVIPVCAPTPCSRFANPPKTQGFPFPSRLIGNLDSDLHPSVGAGKFPIVLSSRSTIGFDRFVLPVKISSIFSRISSKNCHRVVTSLLVLQLIELGFDLFLLVVQSFVTSSLI